MPFSVGDFLAVAELAALLYQKVYKVARKAPEEVAALEKDLGLLSQALHLLATEIQDNESLINQNGEDRVQLVVELKDQVSDILHKLQDIIKKYDFVRTEGRSKIKVVWDKTKFTKDVSKLRDLRGKLTYYYGLLQLVLTSVNGSSLERLENNTRFINSNVAEMRQLITSLMRQVDTLALSDKPSKITAIETEDFEAELAEMFILEAHKRGEWRTIGIEDWLQAAKWWLMKSQLAINSLENTDETKIPYQAYADLLKASWIMTDILHEHPQRSFVTTSQCTVRTLSSNIKAELQKIKSYEIPSRQTILGANLSIWGTQPTTSLHLASGSALVPSRDWSVLGNKLLFHKFAIYRPTYNTRIEIIVLAYEDRELGGMRVVGQDSFGVDRFNMYRPLATYTWPWAAPFAVAPSDAPPFDAAPEDINELSLSSAENSSHSTIKFSTQNSSDAMELMSILDSRLVRDLVAKNRALRSQYTSISD